MDGSGGDKKHSLGFVKIEMPVRYPVRDAQQTVGYIDLKLRRATWVGDSLAVVSLQLVLETT